MLLPLSLTIVGVALLAALALVGWPGVVGSAGVDFCEANRPGPIAQPINTWSNAAFLAVGLAIGYRSWRDVAAAKAPGWGNWLVTTVRYPASYAAAVVGIGLASGAMHASTTAWAAELDLLSMHLWGAWCIAFATTRLFRAGDPTFLRVFAAVTTVLLARIALGHPLGVKGSTLFGAMIVTAIGVEVVGRLRNYRRYRIETGYLAWAVGMFLVAYATNLVGKNGGRYCDPYSVWQAHAVWHVLCAGSAGFVYLYGRSERSRTPAAAGDPSDGGSCV
ncbi:ceramidase domain-containing protein [Botrimarina sp.]|uniref:ceramidase domain-containing protein n=1 Tax=Botrimarina sp. TaxID=2795802 RepID=UPI0032EC2E4E